MKPILAKIVSTILRRPGRGFLGTAGAVAAELAMATPFLGGNFTVTCPSHAPTTGR
jgi:hypothetical protein